MKTLLILALALAVPASAGAAPLRRSAPVPKTPKALIRAISYQMPGMTDLSGRSSSSSRASANLTPRVEALERVVLQQQGQIEFLTAELRRQIEAGNAIMAKLQAQGVNLK